MQKLLEKQLSIFPPIEHEKVLEDQLHLNRWNVYCYSLLA